MPVKMDMVNALKGSLPRGLFHWMANHIFCVCHSVDDFKGRKKLDLCRERGPSVGAICPFTPLRAAATVNCGTLRALTWIVRGPAWPYNGGPDATPGRGREHVSDQDSAYCPFAAGWCDRKSTRLNSSNYCSTLMPASD